MASFDSDDASFAAVASLIALATDPAACAKRLAEIAAAEKRLAEAARQLAQERQRFDQHVVEKNADIEKRMAALAIRLAAASEVNRQQDWVREQLGILNRGGISPDPNLFGSISRG